ncbi:23S rRNA (uracil(1939)-C(5))-methyltransferase RlmD [Marinomonas pollencensis]|uniref:23S rRNA (uracil(1939)-C(5))-methyltransferase RlmD n=1 Tax=Marinomonas pollencensis TaxID=491954 RepID=A0A3E0DTN9_9GAMM|nr:23S rRNA (uracil(1939)-C(5))-methyltransferase RlmD [Marinomonas pollencensis]REG86912.1 23S rRNA m(5)U-1939 methyltransferase [Marinomonas pollencensis]
MRTRKAPRRSPKAQPLGPVQRYQIDGLTHEAKGVARLSGKVTFIDGALPGEVVEAQVFKTGRRFDEARLIHVSEASPHRVVPECVHFAQCGGCSFQHLAAPQQLEAKQQWLQGQLRNVAADLDLEMLTDQPLYYRRRARISVHSQKGKLLIGFRGKASKDIIQIDQCLVLTKPLQAIYSALSDKLAQSSLASKIGHLELLEDSQGCSVLFRLTASITDPLRNEWQSWANDLGVMLYWQQSNEAKAPVADESLRRYELDGLTFHYHPQDFIQVNEALNRKMVSQAMEWLAPHENDVVLDLFCGVGNFSLPLAKRAKQVLGIEVQETMVEAGKKNAQRNQLDKVTFLAADLTRPVSTDLVKMGVTKVLLDPPRAGALEFLDSIIKIKPEQILYVSCNASTLARDAEYLVAKGYQVLRVSLMDMFPQTSHVETMMLLQKRSKLKGK